MAEYDKSQPVMPDEPLESDDKSQLIGTSSVNVQFVDDVIGLEVANNSQNATVYLHIAGGTATTTKGIPIYPKGYYAADKKILQSIGISLISDKPDTDVRIVGHYHLQSENV